MQCRSEKGRMTARRKMRWKRRKIEAMEMTKTDPTLVYIMFIIYLIVSSGPSLPCLISGHGDEG